MKESEKHILVKSFTLVFMYCLFYGLVGQIFMLRK